MNAVSVRPPWGNAVALWGLDYLSRDDLPPRDAVGRPLLIHQGKRWGNAERAAASHVGAMLNGRHAVPLAPEGYPQGIVAVATLAGVVDMRTTRIAAGVTARAVDKFAHHHEAQVFGSAAIQANAYAVLQRVVDSEWVCAGDVAWLLEDVRAVTRPALCNGRRGLWQVDPRVVDQWRAAGVLPV